MNRENLSIQLDADVLEKLTLYTELYGKTQADFINELLDSALNNYFLVQAGGLVLTLPNPQFYVIDKVKAMECYEDIVQTAGACKNANIPSGMNVIADFLRARVFTDSQERKNFFKANLEAINH